MCIRVSDVIVNGQHKRTRRNRRWTCSRSERLWLLSAHTRRLLSSSCQYYKKKTKKLKINSQIIDRHSVSHSEFSDDSQLYDSVAREQLDSLLSNMQSCVDDVKLWMTQNKLQLNEGKTEALLIDPQNSTNLPLSVKIGQNNICFSRSVRNLGVIFDDKLSLKQQVSKICQTAYL